MIWLKIQVNLTQALKLLMAIVFSTCLYSVKPFVIRFILKCRGKKREAFYEKVT